MSEAFMITCIGMGGVFVFLFLLVCCMNILRVVLSGGDSKNQESSLIKTAIALACVKHLK